MGRKKDDSTGTLIILIVLLLVILFTAIALVAPLFVFGACVYYKSKIRKVKKNLRGDFSDFWLSDSEKKEMNKLAQKLKEYSKKINKNEKSITKLQIEEANKLEKKKKEKDEKINQIKNKIGKLEAEREALIAEAVNKGISLNKDGSISARSKIGKELRQAEEVIDNKINELLREIENINKKYDQEFKNIHDLYSRKIGKHELEIDELNMEIENIKLEIDNYKNIPRNRWEKFNDLLSKSNQFCFSLNMWLFSLVILSIAFGNSIANLFEPYYNLAISIANIFYVTGNKGLSGNDIIILGITTAILIVSYFIAKGLFKSKAEKYSPYPPEVSIDNYNVY